MRVLLIAPKRSGGEGVYARLIQEATPPDVNYVVAGGVHEGAPGAPCAVSSEIALNRLVRPRTILDIGFRALRLKTSFDLVHVHAHPARLTRLRGTPVVMSENSSSAIYLGEYLGWDEERLRRAFRRTRRVYRALGIHDRLLAMDRVARVYVFSNWAREVNLRWGADPAKLEVLPPGLPTPELAPRDDASTFTFLFVGSDFERKGGFDVVEAFARIASDHPDARLVIEGPDPSERNPDRLIHSWVDDTRRTRIAGELDELQRRGVAQHLGRVSPAHLHQVLYPSASAFVMPTLAEGYGLTNLEAMSYALPVISSTVGPIPELVTHEGAGLLVPPADVDALAEAMSRMVSRRDEARRMGVAGRAKFLSEFTIERFRSRLGEFYRRAVEA